MCTLSSIVLNHLANACAFSGGDYKYKYRWQYSPYWQPSEGKGGLYVHIAIVVIDAGIYLFGSYME